MTTTAPVRETELVEMATKTQAQEMPQKNPSWYD